MSTLFPYTTLFRSDRAATAAAGGPAASIQVRGSDRAVPVRSGLPRGRRGPLVRVGSAGTGGTGVVRRARPAAAGRDRRRALLRRRTRAQHSGQIGRASCRARGAVWWGAGG